MKPFNDTLETPARGSPINEIISGLHVLVFININNEYVLRGWLANGKERHILFTYKYKTLDGLSGAIEQLGFNAEQSIALLKDLL
jgi:hypothetical protein